MAEHIYKCSLCADYTMQEKCPSCSTKTILPRPPKFSLEDKYAELRRETKKKEFHERGLY